METWGRQVCLLLCDVVAGEARGGQRGGRVVRQRTEKPGRWWKGMGGSTARKGPGRRTEDRGDRRTGGPRGPKGSAKGLL